MHRPANRQRGRPGIRRDGSEPGTPAHPARLGDQARPVSVDDSGHSGHGVYVLGDNSCALNTATRYLVEGGMPAKDTSCHAD
ncbi:alpha/beta hydrolase [Streptomyces sp. NPDC018584]|uniref:alpha/beta hydrolase n=1 Tax=unclassified Streptomyces TaxID=2593676 RepID=UPI00378EF078